MSQENITNINTLVKQLKFIKYNDYKLLLNQLNIIKINSKNTLPSNFGFNKITNRMKLKYIDSISQNEMSQYIYFNQMTAGSIKYECYLQDILNFKNIDFYVKSKEYKKMNMKYLILIV